MVLSTQEQLQFVSSCQLVYIYTCVCLVTPINKSLCREEWYKVNQLIEIFFL